MYKETYCTEKSYVRIELIAENAQVICGAGTAALENVIYGHCLGKSYQGRWQATVAVFQNFSIYGNLGILYIFLYYIII